MEIFSLCQEPIEIELSFKVFGMAFLEFESESANRWVTLWDFINSSLLITSLSILQVCQEWLQCSSSSTFIFFFLLFQFGSSAVVDGSSCVTTGKHSLFHFFVVLSQQNLRLQLHKQPMSLYMIWIWVCEECCHFSNIRFKWRNMVSMLEMRILSCWKLENSLTTCMYRLILLLLFNSDIKQNHQLKCLQECFFLCAVEQLNVDLSYVRMNHLIDIWQKIKHHVFLSETWLHHRVLTQIKSLSFNLSFCI